MKGSEILISALIEEGVDTVFGIPGGAVLDIYDSLYSHPEINHVLVSHEQGAAHAADGYARVSKKVGVCIATSGPGATNLITGIATAYMDSIPVVAITGNVNTGLLGKDSFQEVDIFNVTMPITKHNFIVKETSEIFETVRRAFSIARSGRPGPVLVDITSDALAKDAEEYANRSFAEKKRNRFSEEDIKKAIKLINSAKKPLLYVGGGAVRAEACKEIVEISEKLQAPVCDTLMGKGAMPGKHGNYLGMLGIHGTNRAREAVRECDLLVAIGARFSDRATENFRSIPERARLIHIDIDPAEINKNVRIDLSVIGDCREILGEILKGISSKNRELWIASEGKEGKKDVFTAKRVVQVLNDKIGEDCIFVTDVGQHQMLAANHIQFSAARMLLTSGGLGAMGFGLPAAVGASLACPGKRVINITGDGSFRMNMNELITAAGLKLPITTIILNNSSLGLVKGIQDDCFAGRHSATDLSEGVDYAAIARGMGARALRVENEEQLTEALKEAEPGGTYVIECKVHYDTEI